MKKGVDYIGVGCGAIIINNKDEVLLLKRSADARTEPEYWSRPGGAVELGEPAEQAVVREVKEETGLDAKVIGFLEMTETLEDGKHWIALGYLVKHVGGELKNMEPRKHDDIRWWPRNRLPANITSYTENSLKILINSPSWYINKKD